jgi:hypothetical protein
MPDIVTVVSQAPGFAPNDCAFALVDASAAATARHADIVKILVMVMYLSMEPADTGDV